MKPIVAVRRRTSLHFGLLAVALAAAAVSGEEARPRGPLVGLPSKPALGRDFAPLPLLRP